MRYVRLGPEIDWRVLRSFSSEPRHASNHDVIRKRYNCETIPKAGGIWRAGSYSRMPLFTPRAISWASPSLLAHPLVEMIEFGPKLSYKMNLNRVK